MLTGQDIIIVGLQSWDVEIGSNCKNIALELAKHNRVLYVNYPLDRKSILKDRHDLKIQKRLQILRGKKPDIEPIALNLWNLYPRTVLESINWLPPGWLFRQLNYLNNKRFARAIKKAARQLGFTNYILFNDNLVVRGLYLKELLAPTYYIYYLRDNLIYIPFHRKHGLKAEIELFKKVDVVAANSGFLADYARKYNPHSYFVGQGCEIELFQDPDNQLPVAPELQALPKPIIGYIGALTDLRLNLPLIEAIATQLPAWSFVLVGPENEGFLKSRLHQLPNVHFLGNKPVEQLPHFLKGFDVAINPQLINEITIGNYPRKIDEYLAMGKPTVSTKTPFMDFFKDHVYLAASPDEYITLIKKALAENNAAKEAGRRAFAAQHSWENSVAEISNSLKKAITHK